MKDSMWNRGMRAPSLDDIYLSIIIPAYAQIKDIYKTVAVMPPYYNGKVIKRSSHRWPN